MKLHQPLPSVPSFASTRRIFGLRACSALCTLLLAALAPTGSPGFRVYAQSEQMQTPARPIAAPKISGTDGSTTGTAAFTGNYNNITNPIPNEFYLLRMADCSLNNATVTERITGSNVAFTFLSVVSHFERTLHQMASLTTTGGVFPHGCPEKSTGISSRVGIAVGMPQPGVYTAALIVPSAGGTALRTRTYTVATSSATQVIQAGIPNPSGVATADLNGDGIGDLVVVNYSGQIYVMLGNSDGSYKSPVAYAIAGAGSVAAVIDDVDGDGKLDIVAVSEDQQISVFTGKGDGTFNAPRSFTALLSGNTVANNSPIQALVTADLRGLGRRDIICSNGIVLLNNGSGVFTQAAAPAFPVIQSSTTGQPLGLATGDFNNDGKIDLVVTTGYTLYTWIGKGDGTFTAGNSYASINNTGYVTVSDLDGDGNADIYTGQANGGFYAGDVNEPGFAYALMGNGDGTFVGAASTSTGAYTGNNLGDVNGDGLPDLITNRTDQFNTPIASFTVQLGTAKGTFTPTAATITPPASFVLNGTTLSNGSLTTYAVGDINGDGKADLVFVMSNFTAVPIPNSGFFTYTGPVYFTALSNGDGTFQTPVPHIIPQIAPSTGFDITTLVSGLRIADFNKDSRNDLILTFNNTAGVFLGNPPITPYTQGFMVLPGVGNGTFGAPLLTNTYSSFVAPANGLVPQVVGIADLNGDGKPELIVNNSTFSIATGAVSALQIFVANGDGTFRAPTTLTSANVYGIPVLADLNKDGKLDLAFLAQNSSSSQAQIVVALGNGDATFATPTTINVPGGDTIRNSGLAAADFDADGKVDLALLDANAISGVYYGKGDGTFTSVTNGFAYPKDLINVYVGGPATALDLNKDGKPDILVGSSVLLSQYGSAPILLTSTTTALTASASTIAVGTSITFTATITPAVGSTSTPTGTVTFLDGTTSIGTAPLTSGKATFSTSSFTAGTHTLSATYAGDTNFSTSTSTPVTLTVTAATTPDFTLSLNPAATTVTHGSPATSSLTVSATGGFTGTVSLICTGAPANSTCTISPTSVTPIGATPYTATVTLQTSIQSAQLQQRPGPTLAVALPFGMLSLALIGIRRRRALAPTLLALIATAALLTAAACGGSKATTPQTLTAVPGTYPLTVTGTSAALTHSTTFTVTIQ